MPSSAHENLEIQRYMEECAGLVQKNAELMQKNTELMKNTENQLANRENILILIEAVEATSARLDTTVQDRGPFFRTVRFAEELAHYVVCFMRVLSTPCRPL